MYQCQTSNCGNNCNSKKGASEGGNPIGTSLEDLPKGGERPTCRTSKEMLLSPIQQLNRWPQPEVAGFCKRGAMKRRAFSFLVAVLLVAMCLPHASALEMNSVVLGEMHLQAPDSPAEKKYLGISATGTFSLPQIQAELVIVEIFSMYCPICQAEAENVNKVHQLIENNPALKARVRLIGIGIGNTPFEVSVFKEKYSIKFPLFPDDSFRIQKASPERIRTPTFLAVERKDGENIAVSNVHIGRIENLDAFIQEMTGQK
jgi:rubredoxin/peroxiredoxin